MLKIYNFILKFVDPYRRVSALYLLTVIFPLFCYLEICARNTVFSVNNLIKGDTSMQTVQYIRLGSLPGTRSEEINLATKPEDAARWLFLQ